ncbi:MAG: hypothetical protein RUMPE_01118 [Eubacteriales bacterium SKADARSKE-1]|nr:hypothetical protein [Eubacteriales bacterium SKADARSKE-1]
MNGIEEFKTFLKNNKEIKNEFCGVKNVKEAINLAKRSGFHLNEGDVKNDDELSSDLLDAIAGGGKTQRYQTANTSTTVTGDKSAGYLRTGIDQKL